MKAPEVSRSNLAIIHNTLPKSYMGRWCYIQMPFSGRIKPAIDNQTIMLETSPAFIVFDKETNAELFRFQTLINFSFSGLHSKNFIRSMIYYLCCLTVEEFNQALIKNNSNLSINKVFEKPTIEEIEPFVTEAFNIDYKEKGITPHWKKIIKKTVLENDQIISSLPPIPKHKLFNEQKPTIEQIAWTLLIKEPSNEKNLKILEECIIFYKECFKQLKEIDLNILTDIQYERIVSYLKYVLNAMPIVTNDVTPDKLFRVTKIDPNWLVEEKLRHKKYLSYPPLKLVKKKGVFNRANSPNRSIFYASVMQNVALQEVKPMVGERIIISEWVNHTNASLKVFPLCLTAATKNEYLNTNNSVFEEIVKKVPLVQADWMETLFSFFSSEFIKDMPPVNIKRYDYLFSAYLSDKLLQSLMADSTIPKNFDAIVYPSVAWEHAADNIAIVPKVVNKNFLLLRAREYEVVKTWYDKKIPLYTMPAELKLVRESKCFEKNRIFWHDD